MNNYTYPGSSVSSRSTGTKATLARLPFSASDLVFDNDLSTADVQTVLAVAGEM